MNIQKEIVEFIKPSGQILVRYSVEMTPCFVEMYLDVPLNGNEYVSEDQINAMIELYCPTTQLQRMLTIYESNPPTPTCLKSVEIGGDIPNPVLGKIE